MRWLACALGLVVVSHARAVEVVEVIGLEGAAALAGAGDLDGDGCGELVVGAPLTPGVFPEEGSVALWRAGLFEVPAWSQVSGRAGSQFGAVLSRAGDVDGDGHADFVVGAPLDTRKFDREGRAWVFFGGPDGIATRAPWFGEGEAEDARFGATLAGLGDVDGDGFSDLLIGAPGPADAAFPGRVELFLGGPSGPEATSAWRLDGEPGDRLGAAIAPLWDVDLDGFADFAVGVPGASGGAGRVEVWHGGELVTRRTTLHGELGEGLGAVISGVGDMDGDDRAELALYRPARGEVWILPAARADVPPWIVSLSSLSNVPDVSLSPIGDFDGDGYADLLVTGSGGGPAFVVHGGRGGPRDSRVSALGLPEPGDTHLTGVGDVDCDGLGDLAFITPVEGEPDGSTAPGVGVRLIPGRPIVTSSVAWSVRLTSTNSSAPWVSIDGGDLDGDGLSDAVIGLPDLDGPGKPRAGATYVFYGDRELGLVGLDRAWSAVGERAGDRAGFASALGDVDGDGFGDLVIGAPGFDGDTSDTGRVEVWRGSRDGPQRDARFVITGDYEAMQLGVHQAAPGDVNGDGLADLVVCAGVPGTAYDSTRFFFGSPQGLGRRDPAFVALYCSAGGSRYRSVAPAGDGRGAGLGEVLSALRGVGGELRRIGHNVGSDLRVERPLAAGPMGGAGDIDGDGRDDTWIVRLREEGRLAELRVYLRSGVQTILWPDADGFGEGVAAPGDLDLDGHADLLVAAPRRNVGGANAGVIWLFSGGPEGLGPEPSVWRSGRPGERLGVAMGAVGDVDGDGRADVIVARNQGGLTFDLHLSGDFEDSRPRARDVALVHPDTSRHVPLGSGQSAPIEVGLTAAAQSLIGARAEVSLEVTAARFDEPFDEGLSVATSPIAPTRARAGLFAKVGPLAAETAYKVRGRLIASPRMAPLQVASRWVVPTASGKPTTFAVRTRQNRPPSVVTDRYQTTMGIGFQTLRGTPGRESVLHNDGDPDNDPISARVGSQPRGGRVEVMLESGEFYYVPHEGFWGRDTFTYIADDGVGGVAEGVVEIDVTPTGRCAGLTEGRCESGDYEVLLETASGPKSARCWLEGQRIECRRRADGALLLEDPRCE